MIDFDLELIGEDFISKRFSDERFVITNQKLIIIQEKKSNFDLYCIDLLSCYNKQGQMPICFIIEEDQISNRKLKRINQAIQYLLDHEKEAGTFLGELPGFDEFNNSQVRREFYAK